MHAVADRTPCAPRGCGGRPPRRGFALIAALWLLVALSAVGLELALEAQASRLTAANAAEYTRARAAAEAGLEHARARLDRRLRRARRLSGSLPERLVDPWAGTAGLFPDSVELGRARYRVTLRDAGARLNLNRATVDELRRFLRALRVDYGLADRIAQAVADWRDPDDAHRARGAERGYYLEHSRRVLPRNAPFQRISELRHVKGVTLEIYQLAEPHLTLFGSGRVNLNTASRPVLLALPGLGAKAVAVLLRYRRAGRRLASLADLARELPPRAREAFRAALPRLLARTTLETRELAVMSMGWAPGSSVRAYARGLMVRSGGVAYLVYRSVR